MHARVMTLRVREGNLDQLIRTFREIVIPAAERQEGFATFMVLSNREAGKVVCISMWNTEADMLASEREDFFQEQVSRIITLIAGPPQIERYRVDTLS